MHSITAAALFVPILQSHAFTGVHTVQIPTRTRTSLNTATNPFKVTDIYGSVTDPNERDLLSTEGCVEAALVEYCPIDGEIEPSKNEFIEGILSSYIGPRVVLAVVAILYATNFPLGAIMSDNLPASAATSSRMVLASLVLSPFLLQLKPSLRWQVLLGGSFVSLGYITQVSSLYLFIPIQDIFL